MSIGNVTNDPPIGPRVSLSGADWPQASILSGTYVRLEKLQPDIHGDALWEATGGLHHGALWLYMSEGPFSSRDQFDLAMQAAAAEADPRFYAVVDQTTGRATGRCSLLNIRPHHGVIEVGHLLFSAALQKTRGATEALYLLARYAFELGYRRYEWKCNALNENSRRAALRNGMVFEGIFRQHMIVKGRNRDTAWFSLLDSDWPPVRRAYEEWLAADNFDEMGNQRQRLSDLLAARRQGQDIIDNGAQ